MRKFLLMAAAMAVSLSAVSAASAATVVATPANEQGWFSDDTRTGGAVGYVVDASAPGAGALGLTTVDTTTAKAQYMHLAATPIDDVGALSYSTKQNSASFAGGDASYQLQVCLAGVSGSDCFGFTTLVYEPYQNGTVTPGVWQDWDVDAGQLWSTRGFENSEGCSFEAGGGGAPFYTLAYVQENCPNAVAVKFGVNIGSNNPNYNVETDLVEFGGTTYDFEPYIVAASKDDCKKEGWKDVKRENGSSFKNQGDCVQYVNNGK